MLSTPRLWHFLIIIFCLWHMFAVAGYLLPTKDTSFDPLRQIAVPYVLSLSQWQKWDIFSPNPLRRNSVYIIERNAGDRFEKAMIMDFVHLSWRERAKELKILGRLQDSWKTLLPSYLLSLCRRTADARGTDVRLLVHTTILPSDLSALRRMAETPQTPSETLLTKVHCPRF